MPPPWGGVATNLAHLLSAEELSIFDLSILNTAQPSVREDVSPDKSVWELHRVWRGLRMYGAFFAAVREVRPEIVHIQTGGRDIAIVRDLILVAFALLLKKKVVLHQHYWPSHLKAGGGRRFYRALYRFVVPKCDAILMLTPAHIEQAADLIPLDRVHCLPNTCVPVRMNRREDDHDGPIQITYVGRLSHLKGTYYLLDAIKQLRGSGLPIRFVLVGIGATPDDDLHVAQFITEHQLEDLVYVTGLQDGADKWEILTASDIFVFPSLGEQFPIAIVEALAAGLPIVATSVDYLPRLIVDGENGVIVPPRDSARLAQAIADLATDRARRQQMADANRRKHQQEFARPVVARKLRDIYERTLTADAHVEAKMRLKR